MQWILILLSLFMPIVQPAIQRGADRVAQRMGVQPQQPQPYVVFHEGRWWKYEHGQWYVWTQNGN